MTPKPQHTAGPWYTVIYPGNPPTWGVRNAMFSICNIVEQDMGNVENGEERANAELIAQAPETAANCDHLIAMNKEINALNDRLKVKNQELWESLSLVTHRFESWRGDKNWNSCPDLLDDDVLSDAKTAITNATEKQEKG